MRRTLVIMTAMIGSLCIAMVLMASIIIADEGPVSRDYLWICPVLATNGPDVNGVTPTVWAGDYVFQINTDGGELSQKFLSELKEFGHGGLLLPSASFQGNAKRALAYRNVIIAGAKMTVEREDGKKMTVEPKSDYFRRALYPIEPAEKNGWSGWPTI